MKNGLAPLEPSKLESEPVPPAKREAQPETPVKRDSEPAKRKESAKPEPEAAKPASETAKPTQLPTPKVQSEHCQYPTPLHLTYRQLTLEVAILYENTLVNTKLTFLTRN